ncbi:hypothetical protein KC19_4G242300 [Ceratodon purpureus]|uniref:NmrA-like domain-containing protein n=1 Tax=Ceratodon purpureus TaxID=3225 RepID=A0A8T0IEL9_CERPU|nr:hypothetical protein KC19_4G242300 [Ceratodon purpureus]
MAKSRILLVGATGEIGKFMVPASVKLGHPTFVLVRPGSASDPAKKALLDEFESLGAVILHGDLGDHASLVAALKQVDVVISTVGGAVLLDGQLKLIEAIKEVGHIKRFLPSEFGSGIENQPLSDENSILNPVIAPKKAIQKVLKETGIPHTLICSGGFARWVWAPLAQLDIILSGNVQPPREKITIWGDGEGLIATTAEVDIGTLTVMAADDPRTLNKRLVIHHKPNLLTLNSLVELWEKKIGHSLHKTYIPEAEVQKLMQGWNPNSFNDIMQAIMWEVAAGRSVFELNPSSDVGVDELYPDYKYVTVDEYLDNFVEKK